MSRFGIRKKLRGIVDGRGTVEEVKFSLTYVLPDGTRQKVEVHEGYTVLMASETLPSPISTGRRAGGTCPDGGCGECRVIIEDATGLSEMTPFEQHVLEAHAKGERHEGRDRKPGPPIQPNERLACHTKLTGDGAVVRVKELFDYDSVRGDPSGS